MRLILFLCLCFVVTATAPNSEALASGLKTSDIDDFARYLFLEGDYTRAAGEYKRLAYYENSDSLRLSWQLWVGRSEALAGNRFGALQYTGHVARHADSFPNLYSRAKLQLGVLALESLDFMAARKHLTELKDDSLFTELAVLFTIPVYFWQRDYSSVSFTLANYPASPLTENQRTALGQVLTIARNSPTKSPFLAGAMSAVIPGSGQFYCAHPVDGIQAFLFDSMFIIAAAVAWSNEDPSDSDLDALTILATGAATVVHGANIFGASRTAAYRNHRLRLDAFDESLQIAKDAYMEQLRLELSPHDPPEN
ncbi:hypothetical protein KQI52_10780 [bacterium]|nr:hypothetical protein [bacterium]